MDERNNQEKPFSSPKIFQTTQLHRDQEDKMKGVQGTSPTISTQSEHRTGPGVRTYVVEIDRFVDSLHAGERSRFEVISSITQLLNADAELSPQEKAQSFELIMAEIGSIPETPQGKGKGRAKPSTDFTGSRDAPIDRLSKVQSGPGPTYFYRTWPWP